MVYESFKHIDPDEFHEQQLTLHDCVAEKISYENNILRFYFPDGFWVTPHHIANSSEYVVRTDASVVDFSIEDIDDIAVCVFSESTWPWSKKTRVEEWHMEKLISSVNTGKCVIEFITQYRSCHTQMWRCWIRSDKKPYHRDCQLYLPQTKATFYWNNLCFDRKW